MNAEEYWRAEEQKEKLLEFQRNSAQRTKVHGRLPYYPLTLLDAPFYDPGSSHRFPNLLPDIASDFDYTSEIANKWLTPEERALAMKKEQELRRQEEERKRRRVISIDLVNRKVVDATPAPKYKNPDECGWL